MSDTSKKNPLYGKPWSTHSRHQSYDAAIATKDSLSEKKGLQLKIRRYSDNTFHVKMRTLATVKKSSVPKADDETLSTKSRNKPVKARTRAGRRAEKMKRKKK